MLGHLPYHSPPYALDILPPPIFAASSLSPSASGLYRSFLVLLFLLILDPQIHSISITCTILSIYSTPTPLYLLLEPPFHYIIYTLASSFPYLLPASLLPPLPYPTNQATTSATTSSPILSRSIPSSSTTRPSPKPATRRRRTDAVEAEVGLAGGVGRGGGVVVSSRRLAYGLRS
jgi:hypothetical protein